MVDYTILYLVFAQTSLDANLLRRFAGNLRGAFPTETATHQALLDAVALFIEGGSKIGALERVDPDIALVIKRIRGIQD